MAGLGEACTHIGAVLFYMETATKISKETSCTQQKCQWTIPSFQKNIPYLPVKEIDFTSAKKQHKKFTCAASEQKEVINSGITTAPRVIGTSSHINKQSRDSRLDSFLKNLASCGTKPGILSVISDYSDTYIPYLDTFPKPLKELFEQKYLSYCYLDLLNVSDKIEINMTQEMSDLIERETRDQSNSKLWFEYRAGRITASRMRSVCHTNSSNPSQSLIKTIVYPEAFKFSTNSTIWGCSHEKNVTRYGSIYHGDCLH